MNNIYCHRGLYNNETVIENTIPAFKRALHRKLGIELDICLTKDEEIIVFHDDNLKRLAYINKKIETFTYEELKKIKLLDQDAYIPTLKEVLALINGKVPLLIEIKNVSRKKVILKKLNKLLLEYSGNVILESFDPFTLTKIFKSSLKRYQVAFLITDKNIGIKRKLYNLFIKYFLKSYKFNYLAIPKSLVTTVKDFANLPFFIWTIKTKEEYLKYQKYSQNLICEEKAIN